MKTTLRFIVLPAFISLLGACSQGERVREIDWAKAALARNPAYEILAIDETSGVFTVRDTTGGSVHTLRLQDLIAAPLPARAAAVAPTASPASETEPAVTPETPVENARPATANEPLLADQPTESVHDERAGAGESLAAGPGYSISRGDGKQQVSEPTIEGPGYSITHHQAGQSPSEKDKAGKSAAGAETVAANIERRTDPIICQGDRLMRIDGETIEFTGDAVIAEKGCDLFISNANIRAGGVGIIARQARVHIVNSTIGGTRASYEASEGAEIYVARSTFSGVGRRFDSATMNDLGGNSYEIH
jgi:hypothetical protein